MPDLQHIEHRRSLARAAVADVLSHRQMREQRVVLRHVSDSSRARRHVVDGAPVNLDVSAHRLA